MKIYTSYYGNKRLDSNKHFLVQVSNSAPKGFKIDYIFKEIIPDWNMLVKPSKEGRLNNVDYTQRYKAQLDKKTFQTLLTLDTILEQAGGKDIILLCYEKPENFCHRHILAEWIKTHAKAVVEACETEDIRELSTGQLQLL